MEGNLRFERKRTKTRGRDQKSRGSSERKEKETKERTTAEEDRERREGADQKRGIKSGI